MVMTKSGKVFKTSLMMKQINYVVLIIWLFTYNSEMWFVMVLCHILQEMAKVDLIRDLKQTDRKVVQTDTGTY